MCELAVETTSTWLMVDPWEAGQGTYTRTAVVLQHFEEMINGEGGILGKDGEEAGRRKVKIMLLAGGDLIESFGEPGVWSEPDVSRFVCRELARRESTARMQVAGKWKLISSSYRCSSCNSCMSSSETSAASSSNDQVRTSGPSSSLTTSSTITGSFPSISPSSYSLFRPYLHLPS
jgi:nicotinic acid mononucleotide adenylyltransferase